MKALFGSLALALSFYTFGLAESVVDKHDHKHSQGCGHVAEVHGDHLDYAHDREDHHTHADTTHVEAIPVHANHPHVHAQGCGHKTRIVANRIEYLDGKDWHHNHNDHVHETHN